MTQLTQDSHSLLCTEVLDIGELTKTPESKSHTTFSEPMMAEERFRDNYPELPPTVKAFQDNSQVKDHRILQNLLRNEDKYLPCVPDYMTSVQQLSVTPSMRKIVAEWMLEVIHEQQSQPEVFCLAMNMLDRFLSLCPVLKVQLQLLGSVCLLISSKIREPCPIPGQTIIVYTDYSITQEEIKVCFCFFVILQSCHFGLCWHLNPMPFLSAWAAHLIRPLPKFGMLMGLMMFPVLGFYNAIFLPSSCQRA